MPRRLQSRLVHVITTAACDGQFSSDILVDRVVRIRHWDLEVLFKHWSDVSELFLISFDTKSDPILLGKFFTFFIFHIGGDTLPSDKVVLLENVRRDRDGEAKLVVDKALGSAGLSDLYFMSVLFPLVLDTLPPWVLNQIHLLKTFFGFLKAFLMDFVY